MKVLFIGGSGQISFDCVHESVRAGHETWVFNRGNSNSGLPEECRFLKGDIFSDSEYFSLGEMDFDVICQFRLFEPAYMERDIKLFSGKCGQYIFISSASAYQKLPSVKVLNENIPLNNKYWDYASKKIIMEQLLRGQNILPYTILRPSHTTRNNLITSIGSSQSVYHRLKSNKPVIVHGDGMTYWTAMRAEDFAPPFVRLFGNKNAVNNDFHLTSNYFYTWREYYESLGRILKVSPDICYVPSDTLVKLVPQWDGPLTGDKSQHTVFDNSKIKSVVGDYDCVKELDEFTGKTCAKLQLKDPLARIDPEEERLTDGIIAAQRSIGMNQGGK